MAACKDVPSKLSSLEKAEITHSKTVNAASCFIAEANAESCVWAGITPCNSTNWEDIWLENSFVAAGGVQGQQVVHESAVPLQQRQAIMSQVILASIISKSFALFGTFKSH